jgi:hypothetical protein
MAFITTVNCDLANRIAQSPKFKSVMMIWGQLDPDEPNTQCRWAKWQRYDCPATANTAESIHAKVNAIAFKDRILLIQAMQWQRTSSPTIIHFISSEISRI